MRHDETFKILLDAAPDDILPAFAADLVSIWGAPGQITVESVEVLPRVKGLRRSRFFDLAAHLRWPEGGQGLLLLTEHFTRGQDVDLYRVALYTTALMQRHPNVPVLPVVVISQGGARVVPRLHMAVGNQTILDFTCRLLVIDRDLDQQWQRTRSPILAVLCALLRDLPGPQVAFRAAQRLRHSREDLTQLLLPLIQHFASLTEATTAEFHHLLAEDEAMTNIIDLIEAKGKAEATLALLRRQITTGRLTIDDARIEIAALRAANELSEATAAQVLTALG